MARALLTAQDCTDHVHLIVGSGPLAASRCAKSLEIGARPVLVAPEDDKTSLHYTLVKSIEDGLIRWTRKPFQESDLSTLGRPEVDSYVDAVFVTTTNTSKASSNRKISELCKKLRIPVNVVDAPALCTFTLLSTHSDGPLQIGITTSGRGCALSSRIRREIVSSLPRDFGVVVERLGRLRQKIWEEDLKPAIGSSGSGNGHDNGLHATTEEEAANADIDDEATSQKHSFNALVKEDDQSPETIRTRRIRWLSQICEYWPLSRLAAITDEDVAGILNAYRSNSNSSHETVKGTSTSSDIEDKQPLSSDLTLLSSLASSTKGTISLVGSGPGHPSLLTMAAHNAIKTADFILADKLVPAEVLALIPRRTPVHIARKFPGNADAAQEEMLGLALKALNQGKQVLRLKQGDPYLYGRGAEEVAFFRTHGFEAVVVPGVTSALSAPMFAEIPVTHRAVAEEVLICTGTGRKGAAPVPPEYRKSRTTIFLMALHRLESLVKNLTEPGSGTEPETEQEKARSTSSSSSSRTLWPKDIPCAVIERASCPDQRVIRSTLEHVCQAVQEEGSRPPGLLVVGYACEVLHKLSVESAGKRWTVQEGFRALDGLNVTASALHAVKSEEQEEKEEGRKGGEQRPTVVATTAPAPAPAPAPTAAAAAADADAAADAAADASI